MEDLCRICRKSCFHDSVPIFSDHKGVPLKQMLTKTCPIDITFDDPVSQLLPQSICTDCLEVVTAAYNLQQICIESDQHYRSLVAGALVTVKTEKFDNEFAVKIEEVEVNEIDTKLVKEDVEMFKSETETDESEPESESEEKTKPPRKKSKKKVSKSDLNKNEMFRQLYSLFKRKDIVQFNQKRVWLRAEGKKCYICYFCDTTLYTKLDILTHMQSHCPGPFPFPCEYCTERFLDEGGLNLHGSRAHSESPIKSTLFCDLCGVSGNKKDGMEYHMYDDHLKIPRYRPVLPPKYLKCPYCRVGKLKQQLLNKHILMKHSVAVNCDQCDQVLTNLEEMDHHIMTVHNKWFRDLEPHEINVSLKCCICEVNHATEDDLMRHINIHEDVFDSSKEPNCYNCAKPIKNFKFFVEHSKYHAQPLTKECLTCQKRFPNGKKVVTHARAHRYAKGNLEYQRREKIGTRKKEKNVKQEKVKQKTESTFICPICAAITASAGALNQHLKFVHSSEEDKKFQCKSCPARFIHLPRLRKHEVVHSTERPHVCDICGNSFKLRNGLRKHKQMVHNPNLKKKFECSQCSFKFAEKNKLTQHMLTHTGLKPHECKFCDRAYASKGDLVKHMQKLHVGDEIYQCNQCPRAFRLVVELREHQAEHAKHLI